MSFAIIQYKNKNKSATKLFDAVPTKWIYYFNIKEALSSQITQSYTCYFEDSFDKRAPVKIGRISDIADGKKTGHFYKVYIIKTFGK